MTGEPGSFVELREGRRLMVLAQVGGACRQLDAEQRCRAYLARPLDCALFPFDLERDESGTPTRLGLLQLDGCSEERGSASDLAGVVELDAQRWRELADYQARVARWNRLAGHRRRFHRRPAGVSEWLAFIGLRPADPP